MVQWVCFDWGDTLADIRGTAEEVRGDKGIYKTIQQFGIKLSYEQFDVTYLEVSKEFSVMYRGNPIRYQKGFFFRQLCERLNFPITEDESGRMSDYYNEQFISKLKLLPGAKEVVEFLAKKKTRLALISNSNGERVRQQLDFFNLNTYFSLVLISDELGYEKCSVVPFEKFLEHAKILYPVTVPNECIMIGDRKDEDSYAKKVGMKTIIVKRLHRKPLQSDIAPDYEVTDLFELKQLLEKIM